MPVLSNDILRRLNPSSGTPFHSLHATSHALQPMHAEMSVKKPTTADAPRTLRRPRDRPTAHAAAAEQLLQLLGPEWCRIHQLLVGSATA
jgi:hypothetical protein